MASDDAAVLRAVKDRQSVTSDWRLDDTDVDQVFQTVFRPGNVSAWPYRFETGRP